jgi:hypothetical protein
MSISDLAVLGTRIAELGTELAARRGQRTELDAEIAKLEKELGPLVSQHAQIIATLTSVPVLSGLPTSAQAPAPAPTGPLGPRALDTGIKGRVFEYLKKARPNIGEDGISAVDIADALKVDAYLVRQVLAELSEPK